MSSEEGLWAMRLKHLLLLALVGAIALCFATAAPATAVGNGYVYNAKGRLVGHIESDGYAGWNVSDNCNSVIDFVEGRMRIYEGFHWFHFAKRRAARSSRASGWAVATSGMRRDEGWTPSRPGSLTSSGLIA